MYCIYIVDMDTYSMSNLNLTPGVNHVRPTQYVCLRTIYVCVNNNILTHTHIYNI